MDTSTCDQLPSPTSLKSLVCDVKFPHGNYLIHQLVLNNSKPSDSCSECNIRAALRSFPGARVNDINMDGLTPLHLAVIVKNSFMVKMLLSCLPTIDVDAKCVTASAGTSLHLAVSENYFDSAYLSAENVFGKTSLDNKEDSLEIVKTLVAYGASVDAINVGKETPLLLAARCSQIDILKLLISKGANLNAKTFYGGTVLHSAVKYRERLETKVFLELGAEYDNNTAKPLRVADIRNRIDVLELLISKGVDLNAVDEFGRTPLYEAIRKGRLEAVKVLVESGASVNECYNDGETPLHVAASFNRIDILELLISKGAALNAEDRWGRTPLHEAAWNGPLETVKVLVESGAAVDAVDKNGNTALRIAEAEQNIELVSYFNRRFCSRDAVGRDDRVLVPEEVSVCISTVKFGEPPFKKMRSN